MTNAPEDQTIPCQEQQAQFPDIQENSPAIASHLSIGDASASGSSVQEQDAIESDEDSSDWITSELERQIDEQLQADLDDKFDEYLQKELDEEIENQLNEQIQTELNDQFNHMLLSPSVPKAVSTKAATVSNINAQIDQIVQQYEKGFDNKVNDKQG